MQIKNFPKDQKVYHGIVYNQIIKVVKKYKCFEII